MDSTITTNTLKTLLEKNQFKEAYHMIKNKPTKEIISLLSEIAELNYDLTIYSFVCSILINQETSKYHTIAAHLLIFPYNHFEGAYNSALYHAKRASELEPNNVECKEFLLFFHNIPERLIPTDEALKLATEILNTKPNSTIAKDTFQYYENKK